MMQKKKRTVKFPEWKKKVFDSVQSSTLNESEASELNGLIKQILKKNELDPPNEKETDEFIDIFLPSIIHLILECRSCKQETLNGYNSILEYCLKLLKYLIISDHELFINSAREILEKPNCAFFNLTFAANYKASTVYLNLRKRFTEKGTLDNIVLYFKSDLGISLQKIQEIVEIILPVNNYFDLNESGSFASYMAKYVLKGTNNLEPKEIKDNEINQFFITLSKFETFSSQVRIELSEIQVEILMKVAKSDLLTKQFSALEAIKNICFIGPDYISPLLSKGKIIDHLLNIDMHVKLVDSFSTIFSIMNEQKCITKNQLQQFWKKTIEQPQSTFPTFLAGMKRVADSMYPVDPLLQVILETNEYPDSIINFLQIISVRCNSHKIKKDMYNALYNLYKNTPNKTPESLNLLIKAIGQYVCDDDIEFCNEQQNICLANIENGKDVKLSLHILNCTFPKTTSENARFYFNIIIKKIDKGSFEYLDLLEKIMKKFDQPLSEEEFTHLTQITSEMVKDHPEKVISFYKSILDEATSKVPLLNHNMKLEILIFFCDLPFMKQNFKFIQFMYDQFNNHSYDSYAGIEFIWSYLFKTNRYEVANILIEKYKGMRDSSNVSLFIQNCAQNFKSTGSLYALEKFIHVLQDGIDLQPGPNLFLFNDDYLTIDLVGDIQYQIQVINDICYEGFARKISQISNVDSSYIQFSENNILITRSSFYLYNNMVIQIKVNQDIPPQPINYVYPSQILVNQQYIDPLFNIMIESDPDLSPKALRILNLLPTLQEQLLELNEETEWEDFLCIDMPYLFIYRINMIANLVSKDPSKYVPIFYQNGMTTLLSIVFNVASSIFPDTNSLITLLKISEFLLEFKEASQYKQGILDDLKESVSALLQWVKTAADDESNSIILGYLIHLLNEFQNVAPSLPEFNDLVRSIIFNKIPAIRSGICQLVNSIQDAKEKEELIIPLLSEAKNSYCQEYFSVLVSIADVTENPDKLWNVIVNALYDDFTLPKKGTILNVLLFTPPPTVYAHGLFKTLNSLITRVKTIPEMKKLFEFIENEIIFNPYKYYMPTFEVFSVFLYLLDQDSSFNDILMPIINECKEFRLNQSTDNFSLICSNKNKGIRNMGATCYINSSIQQLYNITRFRKQILLADFDTKDWSFEFQYAFAKLYLFPSEYIDISNFLSNWKGYDNCVIDVHQQQDSVEFLQLFIDRMIEKIPNISSMFTGEIEHKTFYDGSEISVNNEQFTIFPLEVKNQESVTTSLKTFLDPDKFEYDLEGKGKVNAIRLHKVKKAPEILIIQLKRFEYNLKTTEREKINSRFNFSQELDFSPVMLNSSPILYDLCGVVQHTGTANGGHYFSDVKRDNGKWFCINDTVVRQIDGDALLTEAAGGNEEVNLYDAEVGHNRLKIIDKTCNAYLLFYKMKESSLQENQNLSQLGSTSFDNFIDVPPIEESSNDKEGISMECPGINSKIIKRLLPEIKEVILRSVCNSPQFSQLVMKICHQDQDGEFLYHHFTNCLRMASDQKSRLELVEECSNLCKSNQQFADFVLKQDNDFVEFSLKNSNPSIRIDYNNLVSAAISSCSNEGRNFFYSYYLGLMSNDPIVFFSFWECIEPFFKLFEQSIPKKIEAATLLIGLVNFVIKGPAEYDKKCHADQIYTKINLSNAFDLLINYTRDENNKEEIFTQMIDSPSFIQLTTSPYHSAKFYELISHLMANAQNQENFTQYLNKCDQSMPVPAITSLFAIILSLDKVLFIDKFFDLLLQRNVSTINLFFSNIGPIVQQQSELMIKYSDIWIKKFFISNDVDLRLTIADMMHVLLPQFIYPAAQKNETSDRTQLDKLFRSMIDSLQALDEFLEKKQTSKQKKVNDQYPSLEFFDTFQWIIISGGYIDKIDFSQFLDRLKKYGNYENPISQNHLFSFLRNIYGQKIFDHTTVGKFISALGSTRYYDIINALPFIMPPKCNDYINSQLFYYIVRDGFLKAPNSSAPITGICDAITAINRIKTPENMGLLSAKIFDSNIFAKNINNRCINYMQFCWKFFKEYPQASEQFYSNDLYLNLWKLIVRQEKEERPLAKMLASFNFAYISQNKDKKSMFKLKTDKLLEKYEDYDDNDDSYFLYSEHSKKMKIQDLIIRIKRKENPKHPGSGGLCHLLRSLIKLSSKPKTKVFTQLENLSEPMMTNASPVKPIAMVVCDICLSMEPSKKVDDILIREFNSLELLYDDIHCYKAVEYFFKSFNEYLNKRDKLHDFSSAIKAKYINSVSNIRALSKSFIDLVLNKKRMLFKNEDLSKIRDKTQTLINLEISALIKPAIPPGTVKGSTPYLKAGYLLVKQITQILGDKMPDRLSKSVFEQFVSVLSVYNMEKEINDVRSYIDS